MRKYRSISCEGRKGCLFNAGGSGNLFHLYLSFTENRRAWWPYGNGQRGTVFCAVAARLGISLGEKEEQIHIIPGSYEIEESRQFSGTRIYMKSGRKLKQLKEMLQKESTIRPLEVYSVSDCGKEEEKVCSGVDNIPENSGYFTIVIVKTKDEPVHNSSRFLRIVHALIIPAIGTLSRLTVCSATARCMKWSIVRERRNIKRQMAENLRFVPTARIPIRQNIMMPL